MIRSTELKDKLVADLQFHHYLSVHEEDFLVNGLGISDPDANSVLNAFGIDPSSLTLYRRGTVTEKSDQVYQYIDDVFIDYFFRTYDFKEIVFPKGYCYEQITPNGVVHPTEDLMLNLQNIYDRCTFVNNMLRIFLVDAKFTIGKISECNGFLCGLGSDERKFSPAEDSKKILCHMVLYTFGEDLEQYEVERNCGKAVGKSMFRTGEILDYHKFVHNTLVNSRSFDKSRYCIQALDDFTWDYRQIRDSHIFGDYSIEDLLIIYCILVDKLVLHEDYLLVALLYCIDDIERTFLMEFDTFERDNTDYHILDSSINSKDMYLRFTNRTRSKAFKFTVINNAVETIELFNQGPIRSVYRGNTLPLPYLYSQLNLV